MPNGVEINLTRKAHEVEFGTNAVEELYRLVWGNPAQRRNAGEWSISPRDCERRSRLNPEYGACRAGRYRSDGVVRRENRNQSNSALDS